MRLLIKGVVLCGFMIAGCGGSMKGKLGNAACETGCNQSKTECVDKCSEKVDPAACEVACNEAESKCTSECN